jgi:hypothetical protein
MMKPESTSGEVVMIKRSLSTLLALVFVLCGQALAQDEQPPPKPAQEQPAEEEAPKPTMDVQPLEGQQEGAVVTTTETDAAGGSEPTVTSGEAAAVDLPPPAESVHYRRHFALGVGLPKEIGLGALLRVRFNYIGLEAAIGVLPILIMISGDCNEIIADLGLHFTGSLLIFFNNDQKKFAHGLRLSGIYDDKFGPGGMIGWQAELRLSKLLSLGLGAGFQIYPDAEDWAKEEAEDACSGATIELNPMMTYFQPYVGVNLLLYLF